MRNAKKTLSLVMVAIFTTFIVLSGIPAGAVTKAQAKAQVTKATAAVVKVEKTVKVTTFNVTTAQTQLNAAAKEVAKVKNLGKTYTVTYKKLVARDAVVAKKIAAKKAANAKIAAALAKLNKDAEAAVAAAEKATDGDVVDLVGDAAALANAQGTVTAALELIVKLDNSTAAYKGLMARIDAANNLIVKAMDEIAAAEEAARLAAEAEAAAKAAVDAAEKAVAAVEAAPLATATDLAAAVELGKTAVTAVAAVTDTEKAAAFTARLKVMADKGLALQAKLAADAAALVPAKLVAVSAVDGTITVTFDKKPVGTVAVADFVVTKSVNGATAVAVTPASVTVVSDTAVTLAVPAVAATTADQTVVYNVAYTTGAALSAAAYTVAKTPALTVASVAAVNANEIKVVYNQPVYAASAEIVGNYTVTINGSAVTPAAVLTQEDGVSVLVQLTNPMVTGQSYKVNVASTMDALYQTMTSYTDTVKVFSDTVAPVLVSSSYSGGKVKLTFNEPVLTTNMVVKVDGAVVATAGTATAGTDPGDYTVKTPAVTLAAGSHSVVVYNITDKATNTASILTSSFTTVADVTAPSVVSAAGYKFNAFLVTFSESVKATSGAAISVNNFVVTKGNHTYTTGEYTVSAEDYLGDGTANYLITMNDTDTNNPLYTSTETASTLNVTVKNYMDNVNLIGSPFSGTATLTVDTAVPYVVSSNLNVTSGTAIGVKFSETLATNAAVSTAKIVVKTADNVIIPATSAYTSGKYLYINLPSLVNTTYTVSLLAGTVTDPSGNGNAATTTAYDNGASATATTPVAITVNANVIHIQYGELMGASAVDLANYTLDGTAFPAGTVIGFIGTKQYVDITLPSSYFTTTASYLFGISKSVLNADGTTYIVGNTTSKVAYTGLLGFTDNVAPVLASAKFTLANTGDVTTNTITLTFNENMSATNASDYTVTVNGVTVAVTSAVADNDKTIVLTLVSAVNIGQSTTVKLNAVSDSNPVNDTLDAAGNKATTGTVVTVLQ